MDVTLGVEPGRACPRCGDGHIIAVLRMPYGWTTARGVRAHGSCEVPLCTRCDGDDPVTGPIVAYFAVHEVATPETADRLAVLLNRWIGQVRPPTLDQDALEAEVEAWYRGDL
ncbi:DUF6300 family protein [Actinomadura alba]|uniref:Uncharacterized protein n=1 Tax=Actinomadura alba TaxID=406431 RepID=A0ABR7M1Z7_9ACTN|nr:DUF6300 family protein [Actinomadura alba]MBC6471142.1 hypothetical protein [Actinomadura alba]